MVGCRIGRSLVTVLPPALFDDDRELGLLFGPFLYGHHVTIESDVGL